MGRPNGHVNYCLGNLVINEQHPTWDKYNFHNYKSIYPILKIWLLLEC